MTQSLEDLAKKTDALTYLNGLKVTLTQLKSELTVTEELRDYANKSAERQRKLIKRMDNQYRLFARTVIKESPYATDVTVDDSISSEYEQIKEVMEGG